MAEELAFQQRLSQSAAVNDDHRMKSSRAGLMDRACHQFFSGAALPCNQHGCVCRANGLNRIEDFAHGAALTDHFSWAGHCGDGLAQEHVLLDRPFMRQGVLHEMRDLVRVQRLGYIVIGAILQCRDCRLDQFIGEGETELAVGFAIGRVGFDLARIAVVEAREIAAVVTRLAGMHLPRERLELDCVGPIGERIVLLLVEEFLARGVDHAGRLFRAEHRVGIDLHALP